MTEQIVELITNCLKSGNKVLVFGVGGNAANAMHFAAELSGRFENYDNPLPCVCLCDNPAVITAITNDFGWEYVFSRQIRSLAKPGDVVVALSISTKGQYLKNAIDEASRCFCDTVLICGWNTTYKTTTARLLVYELGSDNTAWVQEEQLRLIHQICRGVKDRLKSIKV